MVQIITRQEAMAQGLSHYFTGKPCVRGHIAKRHTKRKVCEDCDQYHNKAITERLKAQGKYYHGKPCKHGHTPASSSRTCVECNANRLTAEERREYKQKYYAENYDKISAYNKKYEAENRELVNERHRKWHANRSPGEAKHASMPDSIGKNTGQSMPPETLLEESRYALLHLHGQTMRPS